MTTPNDDHAAPSYSPTIVPGPGGAPHHQLERYVPKAPAEFAAEGFRDVMRKRRTVREFSDEPVSRKTIEHIIMAASTAPNGANKQPWRFVAVSNPDTKRKIREAAEAEEREFYEHRASERWLEDLAPFGTDANKPFLEIAPWLIVVMALKKTDDGGQVYYVNESVGIAVGMLLAAAHHAGLATLTHTPSPMGFLREVLGRPEHEKPYLLIPIGYPADDCLVPAIDKKPLEDVSVFLD